MYSSISAEEPWAEFCLTFHTVLECSELRSSGLTDPQKTSTNIRVAEGWGEKTLDYENKSLEVLWYFVKHNVNFSSR